MEKQEKSRVSARTENMCVVSEGAHLLRAGSHRKWPILTVAQPSLRQAGGQEMEAFLSQRLTVSSFWPLQLDVIYQGTSEWERTVNKSFFPSLKNRRGLPSCEMKILH